MTMDTHIRPLQTADMVSASELAQRVFDAFEASDYPPQGRETFRRFTAPEAMTARLGNGEMLAWGAFHADRLVGVLATRGAAHISLLFVEADFHRQGIARALFDRLLQHCRNEGSIHRITVNSAPYSVGIYPRLGFSATATECLQDGIRFTPMEYLL